MEENKPTFHEVIEKNVTHYKEIIFALIGLAIVIYIKDIFSFADSIFTIFQSIIYGLIIAFILNVPMTAMSRFFAKRGWFKNDKKRNAIALYATLIIVVLLVILILANVIPNIVSSINEFSTSGSRNVNSVTNLIDSLGERFPALKQYIDSIDWDRSLSSVASMLSEFLSNMATSLPSLGGSLMTAVFAFILSMYILLDRDRLSNQTKRVLKSVMNEKVYGKIASFCQLFADTYYKFVSGQLLESIILGVIMFVTLSVCGFPYAGVISIMAALFQFVPYIGSTVAWLLGGILILFSSYTKVIPYLIIYQVVQFIEGQFIYPRVVGGSVGLPALFTLSAVIVGGSMFGLLGMLFFIPLASVLYQLLSDYVHKKEAAQRQQ